MLSANQGITDGPKEVLRYHRRKTLVFIPMLCLLSGSQTFAVLFLTVLKQEKKMNSLYLKAYFQSHFKGTKTALYSFLSGQSKRDTCIVLRLETINVCVIRSNTKCNE